MRFPTNFWFLLFNPVSSKVLHRGFQLFFVRDSFTFTICKFNYGIYTVYQGNQDSHWQEWWVGEFWALLWCRLALSMGLMKGFALERAAKSLWLPRAGNQGCEWYWVALSLCCRPVFIQNRSEEWSVENCCHLNVKYFLRLISHIYSMFMCCLRKYI